MRTNWRAVSTEELKDRFGIEHKSTPRRNRRGPGNRRTGPGPVDKTWSKYRSWVDKRNEAGMAGVRSDLNRAGRAWQNFNKPVDVKLSNRQKQSIVRQDMRAGRREYQRRLNQLDQPATSSEIPGNNTQSVPVADTEATRMDNLLKPQVTSELKEWTTDQEVHEDSKTVSGSKIKVPADHSSVEAGKVERTDKPKKPNKHMEAFKKASTADKLAAAQSVLNTLDMLTGGKDEIAWKGTGWGGMGYGGGGFVVG